MSLDQAIRLIQQRWPDVKSPAQEEPVFLFAAGWRSGSTMLQRMLLRECLVWGEPYSSSGFIERLAQPFNRFVPDWPPDKYFLASFDRHAPLGEQWTANMFPPMQHLMNAHVEFFRALLAEPSQQRGYKRWGLKEVRYGIEHATYLRWLFPRAKFLFLIRNPYDCWTSYRRSNFRVMRFWPEDVITVPEQFGIHWGNLVHGFCNRYQEVGGWLIRYEAIKEPDCDLRPLESYLGFVLDRAAREVRVGTSSATTTFDQTELFRLAKIVGPLAERLGYTIEPAAS